MYCVSLSFVSENSCVKHYFYEEQAARAFFFLLFIFYALTGLLYNNTLAVGYRYGPTDIPRMHASFVAAGSFFMRTSILNVFISAQFRLEASNDAVCVVQLRCAKDARSLQWSLTGTPISHAFFNKFDRKKTKTLCISHTGAAGNGFQWRC